MYLLSLFSFLDFKITDIIDILLVAFLLYELYRWLKGTAAVKILIGLVSIFAIWKLVSLFQLNMLSDIIGEFISMGMILLIVVFQPEIRKFLIYLGNTRLFQWIQELVGKKQKTGNYVQEIINITRACKRMAASKTGALIVMKKNTPVDDFINTGEKIDALVSRELLENIFFKNSPLHDGAVVVANHRIAAARCILPVSKSEEISTDLGLRHRSAIGSTTLTDAIAIIVSEQTGQISICKEGNIRRNLTPDELKQTLLQEFEPYAEHENTDENMNSDKLHIPRIFTKK
jgi:uncharacterized protein (TIGR00159 family)